MKLPYFFSIIAICCLSYTAQAASLLEHQEAEAGTKLPGYTGTISSPFSGIAAYADGDGVEISTSKLSNAPGIFRIDIRGASSNSAAASISVYIGTTKIGSANFSGTTASVQSIQFQLDSVPAVSKLRFVLETDTGANDTFLDWYELYYVGQIPPPPPAPVLPTKGAYQTGVYRNLFAEMGYSQADINAKVTAAYNQLFHSTQTDRFTGQAILINDPTDSSRAYVWDTGNDDVRSEGLSYGMMLAVQMNRQDDFNKIWAWANKYSLNTSGEMKGYFGWQKHTDGSNMDANPAPDGEEYFVTALFLASNRWGDTTGIYNYKAEANKLLDNMYDNGQSHYVNGVLVNYSLFDKTANQILLSPYGKAFTDPSYHLPAFYELWSRWATNNKAYWAQLAVNGRSLWKKAVKPNGLNADYANFDGSVVTSEAMDHQVFWYDAFRTAGNAGLDFAWFQGDSWETTYAKSLHSFLKTKGSNYPSLYNLDGTPYNGNTDHSPGLVGQNAIAALASDSADAWDFVKDLWNTPVPSGRYRYYDGNLYMFGLLAASGNYKIYCPGGVVCNSSGTSSSSSTSSSRTTSSSSLSSSSAINMGKIEAENYASQLGTQTEPTTDIGGGQDVGYIEDGDNTQYQIYVPSAGTYKILFRVASATTGGAINILANNIRVGTVNVAGTGGWQAWTTISTNVQLAAGSQTLKLSFSGVGFLFNLNWIDFNAAATSSNSTATSSKSSSSKSSNSSSSYSNGSIKIEAESFYNASSVQAEPTGDIGGGLDVGYIDNWDWMTYHVVIPTAGSYKVSYRVASLNGGGVLNLEKAGGSATYGTVNISPTGGWQVWNIVSHVVTLPAGQQDIGIVAYAGGFNLNWFQIEPVTLNTGVVIRARGVSGQEKVNLKINNTIVQTFQLTTTMSNYLVNTNLSGGVLVEYFNDAPGSDVQVDYISVNGVIRQSENQTYNTGVWQNNACGGGNGLSEWMHCNGAIGYGNL